MTTTEAKIVEIKTIYPEDFKNILDISYSCGNTDITEASLIKQLAANDTIGQAAYIDEEMVGFIIYKLKPTRLIIKHLYVGYHFRRKTVATALMSRMLSRLDSKRSLISVTIPENMAGGILFLKKMEFTAQKVLRDRFGEGVDGYLFARRFPTTRTS